MLLPLRLTAIFTLRFWNTLRLHCSGGGGGGSRSLTQRNQVSVMKHVKLVPSDCAVGGGGGIKQETENNHGSGEGGD